MENQDSKGMNRREFVGAAAAALFAGVVITMTGCSDDDDPTSPGSGDKTGLVEATNGHTHSVTITKAQIDAGGAVTLTLTGNGHEHSLPLSAADVANIKSGVGVHSRASGDENGHSHLVHIS